MTPLILILIHCLVAVDGAAYPAPTPAARLEERQVFGISTVWSPSVVGTTVSYVPYYFTDGIYTVSTSGHNWRWCSLDYTGCIPATSCESGTLFFPLTTYACTSSRVCGEEILYSTTGAALGLIQFACFEATDLNNPITFFQVSPTIVPTSTTTSVTTSSLSPTTTTSSQSPAPTLPPTPPKPPVGAIVGGVVGGLAVLVIGIVAVLLFLRRRSHPAPMNVSTAEVVQQQHPPQQPSPAVPYNPKYASYSSGSPTVSNFPLSMHQSTAGKNEVSYPSPSASPSASPTFSNPIELSAYAPAMHGVEEGNTHQVQR